MSKRDYTNSIMMLKHVSEDLESEYPKVSVVLSNIALELIERCGVNQEEIDETEKLKNYILDGK